MTATPLTYSRRFQSALIVLPCLMGLLLTGCNRQPSPSAKLIKDIKNEEFDNSLTFNAVTLEEFDKTGQLWWRVKAKQARYSKDQKLARITAPSGQLYQDGKVILNVSAQAGEVQKDGAKLILKGNIIAQDLRDGTLLRGNEMEWQPKTNLLLVRNTITATNPRLKVTARSGKFLTKARRVELEGQVTAKATNPSLNLRSDHLVWLLKPQTVTSDRPLQIDRLTGQTVTDRATANQGTVDLKAKTATLTQNIELSLVDPPAQISSNNLIWNFNTKTVVSPQSVIIVNQQQGVTLSGDRGQMNMNTKTVNLTGNVRGTGERNQSQVAADRLVWNMNSQTFEADGNVTYEQTNPVFTLKGPKASGTLQNKTIVVTGGRVETQFIPDQVGRLVR